MYKNSSATIGTGVKASCDFLHVLAHMISDTRLALHAIQSKPPTGTRGRILRRRLSIAALSLGITTSTWAIVAVDQLNIVDEIEPSQAEHSFITKELWGVGSTPPYLHDGRATTLTEAILLHGAAAQIIRDAFAALPRDQQVDLIRFLTNLVIFKIDEE